MIYLNLKKITITFCAETNENYFNHILIPKNL